MNIATHFTPWLALAGGALIGLSAGLFILLNGRIAGISGLLGSVLSARGEGRIEKLFFIMGLIVSPLIGSLISRLPVATFQAGGFSLAVAGLLVGLGTRYGAGCTSGHGVCGLSRLSPRSLVAVCCFMAGGIGCVYLMRHLIGA